ncbi:YciK family oxidoreductase [Budviciaceae bacterium BWR-B9]|uniref:YciK family oxidoreductase n=1 Tax=Limnobaculum allomyrinae TaxID=2791986 RepID=A0ABS1IK99_9GAMM|nr:MULTISPECIES: YciK family oxidoreductase [Limnobaculum]MBK5142158.1 YciK family oxidoreductase [Limnobaculum allomyrinae]MBV7690958.1 YciK family oxidoreductase [Limnobaculum sp. M2-1]
MHYQPPSNLLNNKIIMITGASDGIGKEAALTYARYGAQLLLLGRSEAKLKQVQQDIAVQGSHPVLIFPFDLLTAKTSDYQALAEDIANKIEHLDGLLHSAGLLGEIAPISTQDPELWHQVMQVNVNAGFMLTQALLPLLLKSSKASLVFSSSGVGRKGRRGWGAYSVSKFATEGLMQVLADEYQGTSLRVNCINPGGTRTSMRASAFPQEDPGLLKTPADIMPTYLYVMGDDSSNESGVSFDAQPNRIPGAAK